MKKGVLRNFKKFTGKHLCQSLFFNKVAGLKDTFFTEHLLTTASENLGKHFNVFNVFVATAENLNKLFSMPWTFTYIHIFICFIFESLRACWSWCYSYVYVYEHICIPIYYVLLFFELFIYLFICLLIQAYTCVYIDVPIMCNIALDAIFVCLQCII